MRFYSMPALGLAGTLVIVACSSAPAAPGSNSGGANSTGGDASAGAAGSAVAGGGGGVSGGGVSGGGGTDSTGGSAGTQVVVDSGDAAPGERTCDAITAEHASEGNQHSMSLCVPLVYLTNPPSSGTHYAVWAVYKTYTKPFLPGFWVHNLEHGAMVITYNCPGGCAAELADAQKFIDALPTDCPAAVNAQKRRVLMVPNPDLDVRFAASAWGFTLKASCFNRAAFAKFYDDHYGHGLEPVCDDGYDPLTAGPGGTPICP